MDDLFGLLEKLRNKELPFGGISGVRPSSPFQGVEGSPNSGVRAGILGRCFGTSPTVKIGANRLSRPAEHKKYKYVWLHGYTTV